MTLLETVVEMTAYKPLQKFHPKIWDGVEVLVGDEVGVNFFQVGVLSLKFDRPKLNYKLNNLISHLVLINNYAGILLWSCRLGILADVRSGSAEA